MSDSAKRSVTSSKLHNILKGMWICFDGGHFLLLVGLKGPQLKKLREKPLHQLGKKDGLSLLKMIFEARTIKVLRN